jgi:hypothetical protein
MNNSFVKNWNEERRSAPRHKIGSESSILITAVGDSAGNKESCFVLQGRLRDVSLSGVAIIISFKDMIELKSLGNDLTLHLLLPLSVKAIELDATPVRYEPLDGKGAGRILVGARITNMKGRDRILFMEFINRLEPGTKLELQVQMQASVRTV